MLATLGMTVFVFTLLLILGNVIKEILQLLIDHRVTPWLAFKLIGLLIPWVLAFSLPIGMLTAALLVFGRFSADQELTASKASGISLVSLITPVLLLSVAVSGLCAWLNMDLAPACRTAYKELLFSAQTNRPGNVLRSGETVPLGDYMVFVKKVLPDGTNLDTIRATQWGKDGELKRWAAGPTGTLERDPANHQITLTINNSTAWRNTTDGFVPEAGGELPLPISIDDQAKTLLTIPDSDKTFLQLLEKKRQFESPLAKPIPHGKNAEENAKGRRDWQREMQEDISPVMVYMHREVAFSFACIGFTLIGIPLGIRSHRRETSIGVAMAMVLMLVYYSFIVLGQAWQNHPERGPCIVVWLPNIIFQSVGAVLLWRANRGAGR